LEGINQKKAAVQESISAIIPTIGRPEYLRKSLASLAAQTVPVAEVLVVHAGPADGTREVVLDPAWERLGLGCRYFQAARACAAEQRNFAVGKARYGWLLLAEDDVEYETTWVEELLRVLKDDTQAAAAMGRLTSHPFSPPSALWRWYHRLVASPGPHEGPGRVVGAAVQNGFLDFGTTPLPSEWIGGGVTLVRRSAFEAVGGFARYFEGSSPGEDVDLGYRMSRNWKVYFVPTAKAHHHQAGARRDSIYRQNFLRMRSRYAITRYAMQRGACMALIHAALWSGFQAVSEVFALRKRVSPNFLAAWLGRVMGWMACITKPQ